MEQLSNKNPRIEVVDALRGFAVMAILLVHSLEHFIFPVYPTDSPTWLNILDQGVLSGVFTLFAGKSYAIFALLFGFTFYIHHPIIIRNWVRLLQAMKRLTGFRKLMQNLKPGQALLIVTNLPRFW